MTTSLHTPAPRPAGRVLAALLRAGLVAAAVVAAWWFTRRESAPPATAAGHQHGAAPAGDSSAPVYLNDQDQRRIGVTFAPVLESRLGHNVRIVAQVTYDETRVTAVSPRIEGWVDHLFVDFTGREVRAGEPLLTVYAPMVVTTLEEIRLARRLASDVAGGTPDARAQAERLVESGHRRLLAWGIPESEIQRMEAAGDAARNVTLRAPASGVVLEKNVLAGQRIMPGDALYRIADLSVVWLEGEVFEQDLTAGRVGQQVIVEFQALPGVERTGRITYVYPTLNPETRTGRVRVALSNPGLTLKPGMFATIRFTTPSSQAVLSVPRSAVLSTGARNLVFLKRPDGMFTPTDVVLGRQTEDRMEILRGLTLGDTVVASATFLVDAESNLGTLLGGMGDMPGMDLTAPGVRPAPQKKDSGMADMPGMDMPAPSDSVDHSHHQIAPDSSAKPGHTSHRE
jgi:Cu(I)/Ag(I) efflux system membrane fusion protein